MPNVKQQSNESGERQGPDPIPACEGACGRRNVKPSGSAPHVHKVRNMGNAAPLGATAAVAAEEAAQGSDCWARRGQDERNHDLRAGNTLG